MMSFGLMGLLSTQLQRIQVLQCIYYSLLVKLFNQQKQIKKTNFNNFDMVEVMRLEIIASRYPKIALPPYKIHPNLPIGIEIHYTLVTLG